MSIPALIRGITAGNAPSWSSTERQSSSLVKDQGDCICRSDAPGWALPDGQDRQSPRQSMGSFKMSNWRSIWQSNAGANEGNTNVSPPLPPWTLLSCWNGVARPIGLVMMNVAILLNGNRTLTKSCLLFVSLLNVKSSNQSSSSQNEINLTAHTVKMSNHDSYFHLKKK